MAATLDIEQHDALVRYLRATGRVAPRETPRCVTLSGGVSNRVVRVERAGGEAWVLKQALPRLRVREEWFSDPARIQREALGLQWLARLAPAGSITPLVFADPAEDLLAMQAVPHPHENWKTRLLAGGLEREHVVQFGELLGAIHRRAREQQAGLAAIFDDRQFFESLRLEPYYAFTAARAPAAGEFLRSLIADTRATRLTLVHGDYSPKNILRHAGRLVLLDHEVIHWGDPGFDLGFALTHLLSKAHHLPARRAEFLAAAGWFGNAYQRAAGDLARMAGLETRAVRHTLGCLLARVDGRSPLEYFTPAERDRQRSAVLALMKEPPATLPGLFQAFGAKLGE
jgi:aminoglycoside phosphotransferase (APT) family kinase protein